MDNFRFFAPTDIRFGKGQVDSLPELIAPLTSIGKRVLLVYGGGSIKKMGLYDKVKELLSHCEITELSGVEPNPKVDSVREGARLCKENNIEVVLAVGGGSVLDASKVIAGAAKYDGDAWDLVIDRDKIKAALPVVAVITLAATGSEMNGNSVISNEETNQKFGTYSTLFIPKASICDPTYLFSLPKIQTAAGTADIMSHVFEQYFQKKDVFISDSFAESILKTCIKYAPIALEDPENYEARSNLMWASTMALNKMISSGKVGVWTCHGIEHELSAFYDITHGVGLAIITPNWMKFILSDDTVEKFASYGRNVWGLQGDDSYKIARKAIDNTAEFFKSLGIPMTLKEVGINEEKLEIMAAQAYKFGKYSHTYVPLEEKDIVKILEMSL